jgi:chromosome segregation protein
LEATALAYIKRIEIRGFKTFGPKKVSIPLDRGFTVITGPNGSGKSNILDAIRFVLGDLSARSLRVDKMSEVIFDGGRRGVGDAAKTAQINILLENKKRRIPVDTSTVHISRKVNRNGISEYLLNGKNVSRGHLVDILSIAGLSSAGHNVIMQGTITRLTDITPVERRKLIEDLVGISGYDVKKSQAQNQLRQAETNLRIASARIGDVRSRLENLEEERNDAVRYNIIRGEIKKFQAILASFKIKNLEAVRVKLLTKLQDQKIMLNNLKEQQTKLLFDRDNIESRTSTT